MLLFTSSSLTKRLKKARVFVPYMPQQIGIINAIRQKGYPKGEDQKGAPLG
jgi:hypothetical protein